MKKVTEATVKTKKGTILTVTGRAKNLAHKAESMLTIKTPFGTADISDFNYSRGILTLCWQEQGKRMKAGFPDSELAAAVCQCYYKQRRPRDLIVFDCSIHNLSVLEQKNMGEHFKILGRDACYSYGPQEVIRVQVKEGNASIFNDYTVNHSEIEKYDYTEFCDAASNKETFISLLEAEHLPVVLYHF